MPEIEVLKPDRVFIQQVKAIGGDTLSQCYQCAACASVCKLAPVDRPFPRKEMILAQWGLKERLMADPDLWLCHQCNDCSVRCPRGAKPGEVLAALRSYAFRHFAFPGFMGRALSSPASLPLLLLLPILVIGGLLWFYTGGQFSPLINEPVDYGKFIPHGYIEMLFIGGNLLIFLFAVVGLLRFWRGMNKSWGGGASIGFVAAALSAGREILMHDRFGRCDTNAFRRIAHLLIFLGFFGSMATAGLALIAMLMAPGQYPPIPLTHPIKWLGNASGLAMIIGLALVIWQRSAHSDTSGKAGYSHWLFIWTTLCIALSGMSLQVWRLMDLPQIAYPVYFFHLLAVFFLLWYAPYSQLGHMFYRTLAMVFAAGVGRKPREFEKSP